MTRLLTCIALGASIGAATVLAQAPAAKPAPAAGQPAARTSQPPAEAAPAPAFVYNPEGRRDPFVSLIGAGSDPRSTAVRPAGLPGILIGEVSIKGIVKERSGFFAILQGPDNRTYTVRAGDRLLDGSVKTIVADAVVFSQDVNDPLSLIKQKEIRKSLRSNEESRG